MDRLMARLIRRVKGVPLLTWREILEQPWYFSHRRDAQDKLGVAIEYSPDTNQFVSRITRQPKDMKP